MQFGEELVAHAWLSGRVRQKSRIEKRDKRLGNVLRSPVRGLADNGMQIVGELRRIIEMRQEVNDQIAALGEALRGDFSYWKVAD